MSIWTKVDVVQFFTGRMIARTLFVVDRFKWVRRVKYEQPGVWLLEIAAGKKHKKKRKRLYKQRKHSTRTQYKPYSSFMLSLLTSRSNILCAIVKKN